MIYYDETKRVDFSPLKQTVSNATKVLGESILILGGVIIGVAGSLVFN